MAEVKDYYAGNFWSDMNQALAWLYGRQSAAVGGWQGNAFGTQTSRQFVECGLVSTPAFSTFAQNPLENIVIDPPVGVTSDASVGPDGFPINFSPVALPSGNVFLNVFNNTSTQTVLGRCFSLLQPVASYRVDVFSRTDVFYYQGSSALSDAGGGLATWSVPGVHSGAVIAALYPTTVPQPGVGTNFPALPGGWAAHSNMGVGQKLSAYFARVYAKTDIEYLQEDNVPIILQDTHHARCGSSVVPAAGIPTVHILYNDPVAGPTIVFTSLQNLAAFQGLPRSFVVPTSDPLYVPDITATNSAVLQNRGFIYDGALAIIAYSAAGNFTAASKIIKQLNFLLDHPGYLASIVLENAEDGSTARWTPVSGTVTNLNDPSEPPYGTGNVLKLHANNAGATFTYIGAGFPDSSDTMIQFEHSEQGTAPDTFQFDIGVTTSRGNVTDVQVNSSASGPATYNVTAKQILIPIGLGTRNATTGGGYRTNLVDLQSQISSLAGDTLTSITSFKVTLGAAGMDMYFDNLSVGTLQPSNSLSFSYDIYNGQVDQAYIRAGAMAWVCYAYCLYMQMSIDYAPTLYLQRMINFLLTLQSTAADLTNGLFYLGYGKYQDPGYQFVPGLQQTVSTEHQVDLYFAFTRAAMLLPTAAVQLQKTGFISAAQATSLSQTATQLGGLAATIWTKVSSNFYIPPTADPGHFAQGATGNILDTSQALDASGTWSALLAHANGDDTKATECLKFVYTKFYLQNQSILKSVASASYNEAYQQQTPFNGFKSYNDSAGGYSGTPLSVWQEGTWGVILALLLLHDVGSIASYFATVQGSIDSFLTTLISSQRSVRSTTGDGSYVGYSLAARGLPWEFDVWPMLAPTAWAWLTGMNPTLLLTSSTNPQALPYLLTPDGMSQTVSEIDGASSIGLMKVETIDPGGVVKALASQADFVGKMARLRMGFPGQALGDFVPLHTAQVVSAGFTADGRMKVEVSDLQRCMSGALLWQNGGPGSWYVGQQPVTVAPEGVAVAANSFAVSDQNPRYVQGNPLDIFLAAMQNELGVGQDPSLPQSAWAIYQPGQGSTLINPNPYLDVPGILALQNGPFSGDWFEFKISRPVDAKQWLEDQILKVLGLYTIARADGRLSLRSMKSPSVLSPVMALNQRNIVGIPEFGRLPVINVVTVRFGVDDSQRETASRQYLQEVSFQQSTSISQYKQQFKHQIEATGLRISRGGILRAFLISDRVFRRHAFATPHYRLRAWLSAVVLELGDFVWLSHPNVPDFLSGSTGLNSVVCEVIDRRPNYAAGYVELSLLDTRFMNETAPHQIAPITASVPPYPQASAAQRSQYMFVSFAATGGQNFDGTHGNAIF